MKILQKISILVAFLAITATSVLAQETQNVEVSATILSAINISDKQDVKFGNVAAGSNPEIIPNAGNTDVGPNAQFGYFKIEAANNQSLNITWDKTGAFDLTDNSSNTIEYTPAVYYNNSSNNASGSSSLTSGTPQQTSSSGELYIYIGGKLDLQSETSGTFDGDFTFSVVYD